MPLYRYIVIISMLLCLASCEDKTREPAGALEIALEALNRGDYDTYLQWVDMGSEMDAAQKSMMRHALKQHLEWRRAERAAVASIDMIDTQMQGDTICTVYYQYTFADSTKEVASQKMVKHGETWKLRLRN